MPAPNGQSCANCLAFDPVNINSSRGNCKCNPPTMIGGDEFGKWPLVVAANWCRCWSPCPQKQEIVDDEKILLLRYKDALINITGLKGKGLSPAIQIASEALNGEVSNASP